MGFWMTFSRYAQSRQISMGFHITFCGRLIRCLYISIRLRNSCFCGVGVAQSFTFCVVLQIIVRIFVLFILAIELSGLCQFATSNITLLASSGSSRLQQSNDIDQNRCYAYFLRQKLVISDRHGTDYTVILVKWIRHMLLRRQTKLTSIKS